MLAEAANLLRRKLATLVSFFISFKAAPINCIIASLCSCLQLVTGHGAVLKYEEAFLVGASLTEVNLSVCSPPWLHQLCFRADLFHTWLT